MTYFQRMSQIEGRFYEIWKDMSLNDSLTPVERSKLAVWDYPVSDKYTKMWQAMQEAGLPNTLEQGRPNEGTLMENGKSINSTIPVST